MITMHHAESPTIASQARATVTALAIAASRGPVGQLTVLCHAQRLQKLLTQLAEYERHADEEAQAALDLVRAQAAAIATGAVVPLPNRRRFPSSDGGRAA